MLMPKKRFRFNNAYLYGSGAFLVGYGSRTYITRALRAGLPTKREYRNCHSRT